MPQTAEAGPPDFVWRGTTGDGAKAKIEGRFEPAVAPSESSANGEAVANACHGEHALVSQLNMVATVESSLSATVAISTGLDPEAGSASVLQEGASNCFPGVKADFGSIAPNSPHNFTAWIVFSEVVTPDDPHPSQATLEHQGALLEPLHVAINDGGAVEESLTGPYVVACPGIGGAKNDFISPVMPTAVDHELCDHLG